MSVKITEITAITNAILEVSGYSNNTQIFFMQELEGNNNSSAVYPSLVLYSSTTSFSSS